MQCFHGYSRHHTVFLCKQLCSSEATTGKPHLEGSFFCTWKYFEELLGAPLQILSVFPKTNCLIRAFSVMESVRRRPHSLKELATKSGYKSFEP